MIKKLFLGILAIGLAGGGYAWWIFNKPHENIRKMDAQAEFEVGILADAFSGDAESMHTELQDKILLLKGKVTGIEAGESRTVLTFDGGGDYILLAYLPIEDGEAADAAEGSLVTLKCRYSGYVINDESFLIPADIKLEPCYLTN